MKKVLTILACMTLMACGNQNEVKVPENVNVNVAPVTGEVIVKHVFQMELPTILSDDCKRKFPDNEPEYTKCVTDYIKYLVSIINTIPPVP